jgi:hypothetical protein
VFRVLFHVQPRRRNAGLPSPRSIPVTLVEQISKNEAITKNHEATTNNCQHQQCGAIDELHAGPGTSESLIPA